MHAIRVGIVDDQPLLAHDLKEKFSLNEGIDTVMVVDGGIPLMEWLEKKPEEIPEVLLMDIEMAPMNGIEATRKVKSAYPGIQVIILTVFDHDDKIFEALKAGASGYLLKDARPERLIQAVFEAYEGGIPFSPSIASKVLEFLRTATANGLHDAPHPAELYGISVCELKVLECLKEGSSIKQIANKLSNSDRTVQKHMENIYRKLHAKNGREALAKFYKDRR